MDWLQWFLTVRVVIAAIVVIGGAVFGALHLAGPATSSDGKFSVDVPAGWVHVTDSAATGGGDVLTLAAKGTNGIESHFIVHDFGKSIPLLAVEAGGNRSSKVGRCPLLETSGH